jgi:hypothetical protein
VEGSYSLGNSSGQRYKKVILPERMSIDRVQSKKMDTLELGNQVNTVASGAKSGKKKIGPNNIFGIQSSIFKEKKF